MPRRLRNPRVEALPDDTPKILQELQLPGARQARVGQLFRRVFPSPYTVVFVIVALYIQRHFYNNHLEVLLLENQDCRRMRLTDAACHPSM